MIILLVIKCKTLLCAFRLVNHSNNCSAAGISPRRCQDATCLNLSCQKQTLTPDYYEGHSLTRLLGQHSWIQIAPQPPSHLLTKASTLEAMEQQYPPWPAIVAPAHCQDQCRSLLHTHGFLITKRVHFENPVSYNTLLSTCIHAYISS